MRTSLALLCVLAVASYAAADPIITMEVVDDGTPTGYPGFTRYLIYLNTATGYVAKGFDGRFDGPMHQACLELRRTWCPTADLTDGIYIIDDISQEAFDADSHIVAYDGGPGPQDVTYEPVPVEDYSYAPEDQLPCEGIGYWIGGDGPQHAHDPAVDGIFAAAWPNIQTDHLLVAQIVVPDGEQVVYTGQVAYAVAGTEDRVQVPMTANIPEPATLALMAIGGLALIRKRR